MFFYDAIRLLRKFLHSLIFAVIFLSLNQGAVGEVQKKSPSKSVKKSNTKKIKASKNSKKDKSDKENFEAIARDIASIHAMNNLSVHIAAHSHSHEENKKPEAPLDRLEIQDHAFLFHFAKRPGIALVHIHDDFWLFFQGKYTFPKEQKLPLGIDLFEDHSTSTHTIYKIHTDRGYWPSVTSETHNWKVQFVSLPKTSKSKKVVNWPRRRDDPVKILLPSYTGEISWMHPITKIKYGIFTSRKQTGGFAPQEIFPQFDAVESYAGLAIFPKTDSLVVTKDEDGENILIHDGFGIIPSTPAIFSETFFTGNRSTLALTRELEPLKSKTPTPEILFKQIRILTKMAVFNDVGFKIKDLEKICDGKCNQMQSQLDLVKLMFMTLLPGDENAPKDDIFTLHSGQSREFAFWYNLYHRRPQNYEMAIDAFVSKYPKVFKNRITEILLGLPDENDTLEKLIKIKGIDDRLIDQAKLKLALMPPVNILALEEITKTSKTREVQGEAMLELAKAKKESKDWKAADIIKNMAPFLFSFGPKEFEAKFFLSNAYRDVGDYERAIRLLKEILLEFRDNQNEVQAKIKEAYLDFFKDVLEGTKETRPKPLDVIAFYNEFGHMNPEGEEGRKIIGAVIDSLQNISLLRPAIEILSKHREGEKDESYQHKMAIRLAELHLENRTPEGALKMLEMAGPAVNDEETQKMTEIRVEVCILQNDAPKALKMLEGKDDLFHLKLKHKILWGIRDFTNLFTTLKNIIEKLESDKSARALYTTHLAATSLLMSPHGMTFEELRMRYGNLVKGSDQEETFNALTTPDQDTRQGMRSFNDIDALLKHVASLVKK